MHLKLVRRVGHEDMYIQKHCINMSRFITPGKDVNACKINLCHTPAVERIQVLYKTVLETKG